MNTVFTVGKELGSILLHHWIKRYPHLLSTRIRIHIADSKLSTLESGFKTVRIHRMCVGGLAVSERKRCGFQSIRIRVDGAYIKSGVTWSFFAYDA